MRLTSGEKFLALFLAPTVLASLALTFTCLSAYRRESRCRQAARSAFADPPRALTRLSSAGAEASRFTAAVRAALLISAT